MSSSFFIITVALYDPSFLDPQASVWRHLNWDVWHSSSFFFFTQHVVYHFCHSPTCFPFTHLQANYLSLSWPTPSLLQIVGMLYSLQARASICYRPDAWLMASVYSWDVLGQSEKNSGFVLPECVCSWSKQRIHPLCLVLPDLGSWNWWYSICSANTSLIMLV